MKKAIKATQYVEIDPIKLISEEDMLEQIESLLLSDMDQSDVTLEEAREAIETWLEFLINEAVVNIENGNVKSIYER